MEDVSATTPKFTGNIVAPYGGGTENRHRLLISATALGAAAILATAIVGGILANGSGGSAIAGYSLLGAGVAAFVAGGALYLGMKYKLKKEGEELIAEFRNLHPDKEIMDIFANVDAQKGLIYAGDLCKEACGGAFYCLVGNRQTIYLFQDLKDANNFRP